MDLLEVYSTFLYVHVVGAQYAEGSGLRAASRPHQADLLKKTDRPRAADCGKNPVVQSLYSARLVSNGLI